MNENTVSEKLLNINVKETETWDDHVKDGIVTRNTPNTCREEEEGS